VSDVTARLDRIYDQAMKIAEGSGQEPEAEVEALNVALQVCIVLADRLGSVGAVATANTPP
jgi:hypothetical protein